MKKIILPATMVLAIFLVAGCSFSKNITKDEAKAKAEKFITDNLVQPGTKFEIKEVSEENSLYKFAVAVGQQEITAYMTKDGKKFFPQGMDIDEVSKKNEETKKTAEEPQKDVPKSDMPEVKLFVMGYCPYGTQIEKGILPVLETLGAKIKFSLKFVDYAMHDKKELDENLRQYCVQKNDPAKLNKYLTCFLKKGLGTEEACLKEAGANSAQVASCMSAADKEFAVTENYNDKSKWQGGQFPLFDVDKADNEKYQVQGSPTLVINETQVQAGRDSASLLKTICSAFQNPPQECQKELPSTVPAAGFGEGVAAGASDANCGS